jgi:hypothetical protein
MRTRRAAAGVLIAACVSLAPSGDRAPQGAVSTPDDRARLLAGLQVSSGSPLEALQKTAAVAAHTAEIARAWRVLDESMLTRMRVWASAEIAPRINPSAPLCYIFGGPDILMANAMFPSAPTYVLTGLEPVGRVPALETLEPAALGAGLDNLRASTAALPTRGYFITSYMARDLQRTELRGVMPVLYLFLARAGHRLIDSRLVYIDAAGEVRDAGPAVPGDGVPGVRIAFQREGSAAAQTLYYFSVDLERAAIARKPGFFRFLNALPSPNAYLKAASFILHDNNFGATRDFILSRSAAILQDDSGVPFRSFQKGRWALTFFGIYEPAIWIEHFEWVTQTDLQAAFAAAGPLAPLPFKTGYSKPGRSNLMLAVARPSAAPGR